MHEHSSTRQAEVNKANKRQKIPPHFAKFDYRNHMQCFNTTSRACAQGGSCMHGYNNVCYLCAIMESTRALFTWTAELFTTALKR